MSKANFLQQHQQQKAPSIFGNDSEAEVEEGMSE
jgi:hypothetical protein